MIAKASSSLVGQSQISEVVNGKVIELQESSDSSESHDDLQQENSVSDSESGEERGLDAEGSPYASNKALQGSLPSYAHLEL